MRNIEKYYENTKNAHPNSTVRKFIEMKIKPTNAIDLGCGTGRDTVCLIKNDWKVLSIDREDTEKFILNKLNNEEIERFRFERQDFENIKLEKSNLVVANFSIPFCNKEFFEKFWEKISDSILKERILCG
jgi:trans-aconitate methyltransferase